MSLKSMSSGIFVNRVNDINLVLQRVNEVARGRENKYLVFITGIGGIGKTALLRQIAIVKKKELLEQGILPFYMDLDDEMPTSADLHRLAKALSRTGEKINLFTLFFSLYKRMLEGVEPAKLEGVPDFIKEFTEEIAKDALSLIPGAGTISLVAKKIYGFFKRKLSEEEKWLREQLGEDYGEKLSEIIIDTPMELLKGVAKALARDINKAIEKGKIKAVIITIDTTERMRKQDQEVILELLKNTNRLVMVITGREPPNTIRNSKYTLQLIAKNAVKIHKLLALSENDAKEYLKKRGIEDTALQDAIINETGAIPQLLGVAADLLEAFPPEERTKELFKTDLQHWEDILMNYIEKLLKHVDAALEEAIYITAIPRKFDRETITVALNKMLTPTIYRKLTQLSFYKTTEDKKYTMHREVREVLLRIMPKEDVEKIVKNLEEYCNKKYEETEDPAYAAELIYITQIVDENTAMDMVWKAFKENLRKAKYESCQLILDVFQPARTANKIQRITLQAKLFMEVSKIEEAIIVLREIEKLDIVPDVITLHSLGIALHDLGEAYTKLGDMKSAIEILEKTIMVYNEILKTTENKDPNIYNSKGMSLQALGETHMRLGNMEIALKKLEESVISYNEALRLTDNNYVEAWNNRGIALQTLSDTYLRLGETEKAIKRLEEAVISYDEALRLMDGKYTEAWNNRGIALQTLGEVYMKIGDRERAIGRLEEAIESYNEALKLTENRDSKTWSNRGIALQILGSVYMSLGDRDGYCSKNIRKGYRVLQ